MDLAQLKTVFNKEESRFELVVDDIVCKIDFKEGSKGQLYLIHTEVPDQLTGKGIGHKMIREALSWIEKNNYKVAPLCPMVISFLKENRNDYEEILAEGVKL